MIGNKYLGKDLDPAMSAEYRDMVECMCTTGTALVYLDWSVNLIRYIRQQTDEQLYWEGPVILGGTVQGRVTW